MTGFLIIAFIIWISKPSTARRPPAPATKLQVMVKDLVEQDLKVTISSYGLVDPLTQSNLVARVNGIVEFVDDDFREGGHFTKGQLLVRLDKSDYEIELKVAQGQVAEAESRYASELALAAEARVSWASSGRKQDPPPLAVREPQVAAALAALQSSLASAQRAELNLSRTEIFAPYNGQVLEQIVDVGQLVSPNASLARIFSSEAAIVKLPVKSHDLPLLELKNVSNKTTHLNKPTVHFSSTLGQSSNWEGEIVRVTSAVDNESRQLHLIASIPQPFDNQSDGRQPLKIGQYLQAKIQGHTLKGVIAIPNSAIYQNSYVYLFKDQQLERRDIELRWSNTQVSVIAKGLSPGEQLVLTPLGQVPSGTGAQIKGDHNATRLNKPQQATTKP